MTPIDVVILTWNDPPEMLDASVGSALASEDVDVRVVVVDNGSDPPASVADDDRIELVRCAENLGVSGGRNLGTTRGAHPVVCLLDSDAVLAPHSLRTMVAAFDDPTVGVVVPVFADQWPEQSAGRAPTLRVKLERGLGRRDDYEGVGRPPGATAWEVDFGIGACQVFRRAAFDAVGGLDETIFYGPEDVDFCLRVKAAGFRVVQVTGVDVHHPPRRAFRQPLTARGLRHSATIVRHLWKHRSVQRAMTTSAPRDRQEPLD